MYFEFDILFLILFFSALGATLLVIYRITRQVTYNPGPVLFAIRIGNQEVTITLCQPSHIREDRYSLIPTPTEGWNNTNAWNEATQN